ncbi:MAG TPA: acyltransferase [Caulobacteraceae bacterium]|jgi:peptidoglycan/LPS O-acetylase OafA/YrhL|nr:acyltransferase [Caulobacteraceae bacterium]
MNVFRDGTPDASRPQPLSRGGALDGLRFLAAFCMVIHHYSAESPIPLPRLHPVFERGYLATDFFLIVSGYVMARIYGQRVVDGRVGTGLFFLRRASRVVPAHLMMSAAFVIAVLAATAAGVRPLHPEWFDWRELPGQVFLVQALGPFGGKGWNAPVWSLSALMVCYLAFPSLWRAMRRIQSPVMAIALGLLGLAAADVLARRFLGYPIYQMPMQDGAIRALPLFFLGAALAICAETLIIPRWAAILLGLVSFGLLAGLQAAGRYDFLSVTLIAAMVLAAGAAPVRKPSKILEKAALVSFALFVTSEFVRVIYFGVDHALSARFGLGQTAQWAIWFGGLAVAVLFAVAFHYLVDWPSQAVIKPWTAKAPALLKRGLAGFIQVPDPNFDPFGTAGAGGPRVREILLQIGPRPGAAHRRAAERRPELGWG